MDILGYSKCECGAITIYTDSAEYSCKQRNLRKFFPNVDLRKIVRYETSFCCNHCVNHYGLDLCGCGSGEEFGKCNNGFDECKVPMQKIGEYVCVKAGDNWT